LINILSLVYNLVNEIDVEETNERIRIYKQENKKLIRTNMLKREQEELKKEQELAKLKDPTVAEVKTTDQSMFQNAPVMQNVLRLPKPKGPLPTTTTKTNDPAVLKRRMQAGGYKQDYPLARARFEADQTVF
jgi:hypothetical protein